LQNSTTDFPFYENLIINQPEKGYRFSADPFLLCSEIPALTNQTILDIGCGSGVISIVLKSEYPKTKIFGVEIQKELADIAEKNVKANSMEQDIKIICRDIKRVNILDLNKQVDIIVSNPPYKKTKTGRLNPDKQKAVARHEINLNIKEFFKCCKRLLLPTGRVYVIFPAERIYDLLKNMADNKIQPEIIKFIHTKTSDPAKLVIVSGINNGNQQPVIAPPLYTQNPLTFNDQQVIKS
jgi:tRNA1(Val) A37 N6-methylase TrmN6